MPSFAEINSWMKLNLKNRNANVNFKAVFLSGFLTAAISAADKPVSESSFFSGDGTSSPAGGLFSQLFGESREGRTGSAIAAPALGLGLNFDTSGPASASISGVTFLRSYRELPVFPSSKLVA